MGKAPLKFPDAETVLERDDYEALETVEELKQALETEVDLSLSRRKLRKKVSDPERDFRAEKAYKQALKDWWNLNRRKVEPVEEAFPTSTVEYRGKKCDIHGYVHGDQIFGPSYKVLGSLNREVKDSIEANEPVLVEQGLMSDLFPENRIHPLSKQMKDVSLFSKEPDLKDILLGPVVIGAKIGKSFLRRGIAGFSRFSDAAGHDLNYTMEKARKNPAYMKDAKNATDSFSAPMKLRIDYAKKHSSPSLRTLKRSAHQIETAVQKTPDEAEKVNLVVGLGHVREIEHYVENPESISIDTI